MFHWRFDMFNTKTHVATIMLFSSLLLTACDHSSNEPEKKVEIKPAPKLNNDATTYARAAWKLINQIDSIFFKRHSAEIEETVRKPLRQPGTD